MFDPPIFRKNTDYLDNVDDYLSRSGKSADDLKIDINKLDDGPETFLDELADTPPNGAWDLDPFHRGNALENGANVPGVQTPLTFPKIDYYDASSQTATSVKSTDLFPKSYENASNLEGLWKKYVDKLIDGPNGSVFSLSQGNLTVGDLTNPVSNRVLHIITPHGTPLSHQ